jgi:TPR repeat protein
VSAARQGVGSASVPSATADPTSPEVPVPRPHLVEPVADCRVEHPKPRRGEDVTAILTVRRRTAELGGSAAVKLPTGRKFEGAIPAGLKDGAQIRLRGLGLPGPEGGEPGDAIETLKIGPDYEATSGQDVSPSSPRNFDTLDRGDLPKDYREAARLFRLAANREDARRTSFGALFYEYGRCGLPKDEREAVRLYKLAADQGRAGAQRGLAFFYEEGRGGLQRYDREAERLYKLAADQGYAEAQNDLAFFYADGRGSVPDGESAAARLYKLAADQGHADALYWLASFYEEGRGGLQKDYRAATRLYKLAADQGDTMAQSYLSRVVG